MQIQSQKSTFPIVLMFIKIDCILDFHHLTVTDPFIDKHILFIKYYSFALFIEPVLVIFFWMLLDSLPRLCFMLDSTRKLLVLLFASGDQLKFWIKLERIEVVYSQGPVVLIDIYRIAGDLVNQVGVELVLNRVRKRISGESQGETDVLDGHSVGKALSKVDVEFGTGVDDHILESQAVSEHGKDPVGVELGRRLV